MRTTLNERTVPHRSSDRRAGLLEDMALLLIVFAGAVAAVMVIVAAAVI